MYMNTKAFADNMLESMKHEVPWSQTWIEKEGFRGFRNTRTGEPYNIIDTLTMMSQGMTDEIVGTKEDWASAGYDVVKAEPSAIILKEGQTLEDLARDEVTEVKCNFCDKESSYKIKKICLF